MGWVIVLAIFLGIMYYRNKQAEERAEYLEQLQNQYHAALRGTDKRDALNAGRMYYSALRKDGNLTLFDEQAITNDLASMKISPPESGK